MQAKHLGEAMGVCANYNLVMIKYLCTLMPYENSKMLIHLRGCEKSSRRIVVVQQANTKINTAEQDSESGSGLTEP